MTRIPLAPGWGSYNFVFGKNLRRQVFGYNPRVNSSALRDIVPFQAYSYDPARQTKGDLLMTTDTATWNACLLNALALPALPRLGACPPEMQLRDNLSHVPVFDERKYYAASAAGGGEASGSEGGSNLAPAIPGDGDTSHLTTPLTRSQVLHFARRIGYSVKSLGLEQYFAADPAYVARVQAEDALRCPPGVTGPQVVNPHLESRRFSAQPVRTGSMLDQSDAGGAYIPAAGEANPFLEIDVGKPMVVHGFVTQARGASWCDETCGTWVKTARVQYRLEDDGPALELPQTFACNVIGTVNETVENQFAEPVVARFVRIIPVSCQVVHDPLPSFSCLFLSPNDVSPSFGSPSSL